MTMLENLMATCREQPDEWALADANGTTTRAALFADLLRLAAHLVATGRRVPVAVLTERSAESIVALLAVNWAGRAFVPLDAYDSPEHLRAIVHRIGDCDLLDATKSLDVATVLGVDRHRVLEVGGLPEAEVFPPVSMEPDDLGYLLFTSGSTGMPKGVPRRVREDIAGYESWLRRTSSTRVPSAVFAPIHFLAGFRSVMRAVSAGRATMLIDPRRVAPTAIRDLVEQHGIQRISVTPSFGRALDRGLRGSGITGLVEVRAVGEALSWSDVEVLRRLAPGAVIRAGYGASETSGAVTRFVLAPGDRLGEGPAPLGSILDPGCVRLEYIDDERAELIVRGEVAEGYWNDDELTAARFGVDPDGVRFWRSGDIVSVCEDGTLAHRGRVDDMVKVGGVLVEPAEAERVLRGLPGVRAAVVIPRTMPSGRQQFVAHIEADDRVSPKDVRETLERELPSHLVPPVLMRHDALPVTDRGKVDRHLLRTAVPVPWRLSTPALDIDPMVLAVTEITMTVVGVAELLPDDDLWAVGLDSIAAVELTTQLTEAFGGDVQPNDLLHHRTARTIASALQGVVQQRRSTVVRVNDAQGAERRHHLHFVAGAGGPAIQYRPLSLALGSDWGFTAYEQIGLHQRALPDLTVEAAAARHLRSLRLVQPSGPYLLAGHSAGGLIAHRMAATLETEGEQVTLLLLDALRGTSTDTAVRTTIDRRPLGRRLINGTRMAYRLASTPNGHRDRYRFFFLLGSRSARRYRPPAISSPVILLHPAHSTAPQQWLDHRSVTAIEVPGDHNSMLLPPAVSVTAEILRSAITRLSVDRASP